MKKTLFVVQLPNAMQAQIEEELKNQGFAPEDISNALESRLSDLSDTLDITPYLCSEYRVTFKKDGQDFFECTVAHKNAEMAVYKAMGMFNRTTGLEAREHDFSFRYVK